MEVIADLDHTWGYGSVEMYAKRWSLIKPHLSGSDFVLIDWGSDAGWFSISVARAFPQSTVISIEAGIMSDGQGLRMHREKSGACGVSNNLIVDSLFGPDTFDGMRLVPSDYQLALSVFHHLGDGFGRYLDTVDDWNKAFCSLVRGSNVTFFEIPNEGNSEETPHRIRDWYDDRDVESVIRSALEKADFDASIDLLGETMHGSKGSRKLFKISLGVPAKTATAGEIAFYIESAGKNISIRPYRRFRLFASRLLRLMGFREKQVVTEN
jgi:hypothetical protein